MKKQPSSRKTKPVQATEPARATPGRWWIRSGWYGVLTCAVLIVVFLFLNNAGAVTLSDGTSFSLAGVLAMLVGWPTILGIAIGGLSSWGAGGSTGTVLVCFIGGAVVNGIYAFGLGVLVGWLRRKVQSS